MSGQPGGRLQVGRPAVAEMLILDVGAISRQQAQFHFPVPALQRPGKPVLAGQPDSKRDAASRPFTRRAVGRAPVGM